MDERIKSLLSILAIFVMGLIAGYVLLDSTAKTQAIREARYGDCLTAGTGQHCKMADGREAVIITARGAK